LVLHKALPCHIWNVGGRMVCNK